jgi:hypothetical protein
MCIKGFIFSTLLVLLLTMGVANAVDLWGVDSSGCKLLAVAPAPLRVTWSGKCVDGYAQGGGVAEWFTGQKILTRQEGEFDSGKMIGKGHIQWLDVNADYKGDIVDGVSNGYGVIVFSDGVKVEGVFKDGELQHGDVRQPDGFIYSGYFLRKKLNGKGKKYYRMEMCTKEILGMVLLKDVVYIGGLMVIVMKGALLMISLLVREKSIGSMEIVMRVISLKES